MNLYGRSDVLRILRITARQLLAWEKAGLIAPAESYTFFELLQVKKLRDLSARRVRPAVIRESLQAMQRAVSGLENPLLEASTFATGKRVVFRHRGTTVEPIAGQFVMDFASKTVVPAKLKVKLMRTAETVAEFFARGIALEEDAKTQLEAIAAYTKCLELDPEHAAAHINLGTLYYSRQDYVLAEQHYRKAVESDPRYALAHFDLGNVLDETGRLQEAIQAYRQAIQLAPTYADAHYNLALAYEKLKQPRRALNHWRAYVRLDTAGPWSIHARNQIRKILEQERLRVVYRRKNGKNRR
ncbi:MAG TPA: tetratricopeptide repeat protein [Terriglobales bacterium]|nr:tetratricopeptide repeat protein [Terriglobales bacterium]